MSRSSVFLFFISYALLQFWKRYGMGGQKTCLYSWAPLPPSCSPFRIFSFFSGSFSSSPSFFFFPDYSHNEISKAFLSSICASVTEGDRTLMVMMRRMMPVIIVTVIMALWTCCMTLNPKVDT